MSITVDSLGVRVISNIVYCILKPAAFTRITQMHIKRVVIAMLFFFRLLLGYI